MTMLQIKPRNADEQQFIEQLLRRTKIKFDVIEKETPKQTRKREFLEGLERSVEQMNAALRGEIKLKSARELLDEL